MARYVPRPNGCSGAGGERAGSFRRVNVISHDALIASGEAVLNPHTADGRMLGDMAAALVTEAGAVFCGVCIDTGSGTGFCAEHATVAAAATANEYKITKLWPRDATITVSCTWLRRAGGAGSSSARPAFTSGG